MCHKRKKCKRVRDNGIGGLETKVMVGYHTKRIGLVVRITQDQRRRFYVLPGRYEKRSQMDLYDE